MAMPKHARQMILSNGNSVAKPRSNALLIALVIIAFSYVSVKVTGFSFAVLAKRGHQFWYLLAQMFPFNTKYLPNIWTPLFDTIKMSLLGCSIGAVLAIPFAMLASNNLVSSKIVISAVRVMFSILRTLPTLVTALIATYIWGLGTLAGTIAIFVFSFSYLGKLLYEEIETVDMGPYEAMQSMGLSWGACFRYAILPQILPFYISNSLYCFEGNVRYAAILGYVGAGGLGLILSEKISYMEWDKVGMILLMLFFTVAIIESTSHYIRSKIT
ncbi:MAG: phosphonate ABC transporter, permease protein PhnE [Spirochaetia bacterium]|jgi:phosphonate transport system permease protein|nr:phosphonate ABC transporter, permease protein PhnE [Spirochaetia bacterium]